MCAPNDGLGRVGGGMKVTGANRASARAWVQGELSNLAPVAAVPTGRRRPCRGELGGDGVDLDVLDRVRVSPEDGRHRVLRVLLRVPLAVGDGRVVKHLVGERGREGLVDRTEGED